MTRPEYLQLAEHYEACFAEHGATHLGVDWPDADDAAVRYDVMLDICRSGHVRPTLLDFGCGAAGLLSHLHETGRADAFEYRGHDISETYIAQCRAAFPNHSFTVGDVLAGASLPGCDYVVANGVFTEKLSMRHDTMFDFLRATVEILFGCAHIGLAFNVMSTHVDWERDDLFHVDPGEMIDFVTTRLSRQFAIRQDYGLREYTVYVLK